MNIFLDLNLEWKTIIIATHDKNIVNDLQKRVVVFENKLVTSDTEKWEYLLK